MINKLQERMYSNALWSNLIILFCLLIVFRGQAQAHTPSSSPTGILIMAHGGTPEWNAAVQDAISSLQSECPVVVAFGMAEKESLQQGIAELEARGVRQIAVVRLFVSGASFLHQTEYLLGLRPDPPAQFLQPHGAHTAAALDDSSQHGTHVETSHANTNHHHGDQASGAQEIPPPLKTSAQIVLSRPGLIDSGLMSEILRERAGQLSAVPAPESILILAHGAGDDQENDDLIAKITALAKSLEQLGAFRAIGVETLREDWPEKRKPAEVRIRAFVEQGNQNGGRVIVIPFRLFGFGPYHEVLAGLTYVSGGQGLLPHPLVAKWIKIQAEDCFARAGWKSPFSQSNVQK